MKPDNAENKRLLAPFMHTFSITHQVFVPAVSRKQVEAVNNYSSSITLGTLKKMAASKGKRLVIKLETAANCPYCEAEIDPWQITCDACAVGSPIIAKETSHETDA